jgi:hypothetical protein
MDNPNLQTVSYRDIATIPFASRQALQGNQSVMDMIARELTPGQRAALFPNYFKQALATNAGQESYFGVKAKTAMAASPTDLKNLNKSSAVTPYLSSIPKTTTAEIGKTKSASEQPTKTPVAPGKQGTYRPVYQLNEADLSDDVINTIAGEARLSDSRSLDGVVNNLFNRLGTKDWGPSGNLHEVARAPGQYAGYRKATKEEAEMIRQRIREVASGAVPDPTNGADAYRASYYLEGEGRGKTFDRLAQSQGYNDVGGNVYAKDPNVEPGPYATYSAEKIAENLKQQQQVASADGTITPKIGSVESDQPGESEATITSKQYGKNIAADLSEQDRKVKPIDDPLGYLQGRNPRGAELGDVDPVILKSYSEGIQQFELDNPGYHVEVFGESSGVRHSGSTRNHGEQPGTGKGGAMDFVIVDSKTGEQLTNFNKPYEGQVGTPGQAAPLYAKLHSAAALAQAYYFPDSTTITPGIGFKSGETKFDLMHGDITHPNGAAGYNWETGWDKEMMQTYGIPENVALGSPETKAKLAQQIYGKVDDNGNYTSRMTAVKDEQTNTTTFVAQGLSPDQQDSVQTASLINTQQQTSDTGTAPPYTSQDLKIGDVEPEQIIPMAEGGTINKPYLANPVDGNGPKVLMGEKGPESIVPHNKVSAADVGQQSWQQPVQNEVATRNQQIEEHHLKDEQQHTVNSMKMKQGVSIDQAPLGVNASHPPVAPSVRKAYADAKLEPRLNNLSPIGAVYSNHGY